MTEQEAIQFLESYQKNKALEKIQILHIQELEQNAITAKGINYESNGSSFSGTISKSSLPEYIYSKIMDMKEDLLRAIYSNSIRLKYIEEYIYKLGVLDTRAATLLTYKYVFGFKTNKIESEFNYSHIWTMQLMKQSLKDFCYKIMDEVNIQTIEKKIYDESVVSRAELDKFYEKYISVK